MSILIVLLLLVPSIMAVPQTQDNGNNLQEEESEPLEPLVPPGEPQQEWITFKRVIYREYLPECERYFVGFVFLIIKYNWFTKVISDADMLVFTVGTFPYRKAALIIT